jgi:hypothetical protein
MTNAVLGNTYSLSAQAFDAFNRSPGQQIVHRQGPARIPDGVSPSNARLFDVEGQHAPLSYAYGYACLARQPYWAALEDLSMYFAAVERERDARAALAPGHHRDGVCGQGARADADPGPGRVAR